MEDNIESDEQRFLLPPRNAANSEPTGCGASLACDPRRSVHRYLVLIFICFLSFGSYYVYDNPAALQDVMKADLGISTAQFSRFYAVYSWPNVILCLFGGFLIDRVFGVRLGALLFCGLVTIGQIVFALGALVNNYILMLIGRFIFGMGGENLGVAQNTYAVSWFQGRELNMVFGLQLSFSRVGSTVNFLTMQPLYTSLQKLNFSYPYQCLSLTLFIGGSFCLLSVFCASMMFFFDRRAQRILRRDEAKTGEKIRIRDIKDFGVKFWLICIICVTYYVTIFPFISMAQVFLENKYGLDALDANTCNSLVYIISACASPVCGFGIDKIGKNIYWLLVGIIFTIVSHGILTFTFVTPYVPMVLMGLSYSVLASALWPLVSHVIPKHQISTAYGLMQSVQNFGLAMIATFNGDIVDKSGYFSYELMNLVFLCVALIATVGLYLFDFSSDGLLNLSSAERKILAERKTLEISVSDEQRSIDT